MIIAKNTVVKFHYRLSENGEEIENSFDREPALYLHGRGSLVAGLEKAMKGRRAGEQFSVELEPEQGYGPRRERAERRVPIKHLLGRPRKIRPGQIVHVNTDRGPLQAVVLKVGRFHVDVDTNHPLAGKRLRFDVDILEVRDASREEVEHGHAHGAGGHQH